jgi:Kdo2-lipid IVA lauroyltransferase/acyltransferase
MSEAPLPLKTRLEALGARLLFLFFRAMPLDWASGLGGFVARTIGPRLGASKRAVINLRRAMPELDDAAITRIVRGMWDNLGRVIAEYPHLGEIEIFKPGGRVELQGLDLPLALRDQKKQCIFFSAHYGNWEIAVMAAVQAGYPTVTVFRAANNPLVDRILAEAREPVGSTMVPKGPSSARQLIAALEKGASLLMLVDQKMNDGIAVPFFGRDAMTAPALARLARRYDLTVIPSRVERLRGAHFRLICDPPLHVPKTKDQHADVLALMTEVNAAVERWIRLKPEQWFWLHRRWPDES